MNQLLHGAVLAAAVCLPPGPQPGPGSPDPFRAAAPAAVELNAGGKTLYREGKWEAAREKYRAALAADPDYLPAQLNIACSYVRQERFADGVDAVVGLVERAYMPWAREVLEAADLGALKPRPEMKRIDDAIARSARAWAAGLDHALPFVARTRRALALTGEGVLVLGPQQEIFAWSPEIRRYRQLTAEDGRVLAMARSNDGRRILYATAEKLVRPTGEGQAALRGVSVRVLELGSLTRVATVALPGDVRRLALGFVGALPAVELVSDRFNGSYTVDAEGVTARRVNLSSPTVLTASGVVAASRLRVVGGACAFSARDRRNPGGLPTIEAKVGTEVVSLSTRYGAGLQGLPLE